MNWWLAATGALLLVGAIAHTIHGGWKILPPWIARLDNSDTPLLRLAWYIWSIAYLGLSALCFVWAFTEPEWQVAMYALAAIFAVGTLLSIGLFRSFHPSQALFLLVSCTAILSGLNL